MIVRRHLLCCAVLSAMWTCGSALADDFAPPPWRGGPLSTLQAWEFLSPQNPILPDDPNVAQSWGDASFGQPTATMLDMHWDLGDGDGGWIPNGTVGSFIELYIPNWIDFEPIKWIRVQITHTPTTGIKPQVTNITAVDNLPGPVTAGALGLQIFVDDFHNYQDLYIQPNPNYETIYVFVPADVLVDQIVVDTISFPEPASMAMLALGGLVMLRRDRAQVITCRRA